MNSFVTAFIPIGLSCIHSPHQQRKSIKHAQNVKQEGQIHRISEFPHSMSCSSKALGYPEPGFEKFSGFKAESSRLESWIISESLPGPSWFQRQKNRGVCLYYQLPTKRRQNRCFACARRLWKFRRKAFCRHHNRPSRVSHPDYSCSDEPCHLNFE